MAISIKLIMGILFITAQQPAILTIGMLSTLTHITGSKIMAAVIYHLLHYSKRAIWQ